MKRRIEKKNKSRSLRQTRWELIHAAGCVESNCATKWFIKHPDMLEEHLDIREDYFDRKISVPRSLRKYFGRYT